MFDSLFLLTPILLLLFFYILFSIFSFSDTPRDNKALLNITITIILNKYPKERSIVENFIDSSFYSYFYQNNKEVTKVNDSLEKLIISNYEAYKRTLN